MYFLWDPLNWLKEGVMGAIEQGIRTLCFSLSTLIYRLIINLYDLFEILCTARMLDSSLLEEISERIGLVLGIVMFFNVTLAFIKMLIDPDSMSDKEKGAVALIKKALIVIVMLGVSNFAFSTLYSIQRTVIKSHTISNLILPYTIQADKLENFGSVLSEELMYSFYQVEDFSNVDEINYETQTKIKNCQSMVTAFRNQILFQNRFDLGYNCLNETVAVDLNSGTNAGMQTQEVFIINFNWAICVLAGLAVAYLLLMYCFKVGIRMVQLMFLEVISPMAIVSYLSPKKDTMFSKWTKVYVATYIDVFIRMAIINFVIFLIAALFTSEGILTAEGTNGFIFWESVGNPTDFWTKSFFNVVIILSLLTFAHKAPDLLKELLPASASKLGFGASMKDIVGLQKGVNMAAGFAGGAAVGLLAGRPLGAIGGALKGGLSGFSGKNMRSSFAGAWKAQSKANKTIADVRANGGSWFGHQMAQIQQGIGMPTAYNRDENAIAEAQRYVDMYNDASKEAEGEAIKNGANYRMRSHDGSVHSLRELSMLQNDQNLTSAQRTEYSLEYDRLLKAATQFNLDYGAAMENSTANFNNNGDFDFVRSSSGNNYNSNNLDGMSSANREKLIGTSNAKIEANMSELVGEVHSGRGKKGKQTRNDNSSFITETKVSEEYRSHKANNGK